jgi:hypothetical protein
VPQPTPLPRAPFMCMYVYIIHNSIKIQPVTAKRLTKLNFSLSIISSPVNKHIPFQQTSFFMSSISAKERGVTPTQAIKIFP